MSFYEQHYGQRTDTPVVRAACRLLNRQLAGRGGPLRFLDIGCGDMRLTEELLRGLTPGLSAADGSGIEGWDVSEAAVQAAGARGRRARVVDICGPTPADAGRFDVVVFLEVLEHVVDTDRAVRNIRALLAPDGLLLLSTPNLASWFNRFFLLLGLQPHCTEVSFEPPRFGNPVTQRLIPGGPAGHLRVFTWRALRQFLAYHGFEILAARGVANHGFDPISHTLKWFGPALCGDICLVARAR